MATSCRISRIFGVPGCECRLPLPLPVRSSSCAASIARRPVTTEPSDETQSESSVMTAAATLASPFVQADPWASRTACISARSLASSNRFWPKRMRPQVSSAAVVQYARPIFPPFAVFLQTTQIQQACLQLAGYERARFRLRFLPAGAGPIVDSEEAYQNHAFFARPLANVFL